jgi:dipeptidyl aminopeptidase/acylaminoacyl peptidase
MNLKRSFLLIGLILIFLVISLIAQDKKALELSDLMKFKQIQSPSISDDGEWVAFASVPDRGDPEVHVHSTSGIEKFLIPMGENPVISSNGKWVAAVHAVPAEKSLKAKPGKSDELNSGMVLLNTSTGEQTVYEQIKKFTFSNDSKWLISHSSEENGSSKKKNGDGNGSKPGTTLQVLSLENSLTDTVAFVSHFALDSISEHLAYVVADTNRAGNGVYSLDLSNQDFNPQVLYSDSSVWASNLSWNNRSCRLAFLGGTLDEEEKKAETELFLWFPGKKSAEVALKNSDLEEGWTLYHTNQLRWTKDGQRLFLGIKPASEIILPEEEKADSLIDIFSEDDILSKRTVDVWHWNDPYINSNQKKRWKSEKDKTYTGVYYLEESKFVPLASTEMPGLSISETDNYLVGSSSIPYAQRTTWDGRYNDYYLVDLKTGEKRLAVQEQQHSVRLSPDGKYLVYYKNKDWYLVETATLNSRNLTQDLEVSFADEDWDYPADVPGYRMGPWLDGSEAILLYDKYDIWQFPTSGDKAVCLTEGVGRASSYQFRVRILDREQRYLEKGEKVFLSAYHDLEKHTALYSMKAGTPGVSPILEEEKKYTLIAKAREADQILFSRQSYTEFPDLWVSDNKFKKPLKLSDVNPQVSDFAWGDAELVEWNSIDGTPLQGILIKPGNYEPGKEYPVLVYYYRFFSNRLYDFNTVAINHRPCFPYYASNGYAIFLPDIRFDVGNPGYSATKCLVPGVQKLIDMGVADPDAICLHGHSWSGYQTAFAITQTKLFTCAIAGAPVSNMTSAYSGIRWGTGLARQFQYEKSQSRIGGSLWEARDKYIENSPVFFADRIETPLLIMFGDVDDAVPWYQGIELYLAMRRLGKDCVFLQYRNEPHHPKKYANKLDYTIRFKEYLDHYLKGEPAAEWIKSGIPYNGK